MKTCKKCGTPIPIDVMIINQIDLTKKLEKHHEQVRALAFLDHLLKKPESKK